MSGHHRMPSDNLPPNGHGLPCPRTSLRYVKAGDRRLQNIGYCNNSSPRTKPVPMSKKDFVPMRPPEYFDGNIAWTYASLSLGGIARQMLSTGRILASQGMLIDCICNDVASERSDPGFAAQAKDVFHEIYSMNDIRGVADGGIASVLSQVPELRHFSPKLRMVTAMYAAAFVRRKYRIVHNWSTDFLLPAVAAAVAGVPRLVISGRSMSQRTRSPYGLEGIPEDTARFLLSWLLSFPGCVVSCNSEAGCADHADWLGLAPGDVPLMINALEPEKWEKPDSGKLKMFRDAIGIPENARVLGGLGRVSAVKDPELWCIAAKHVLEQRPDVVAVLGGDGYEVSELAGTIASHPIGKQFFFPGKIPDASLFYHNCDVFLLTSLFEGLPNVVLEAQCCAVPVVSVDAGGAKEVVDSGRTGFIAQGRSHEELARLVLSVLDNEEWAREAGRLGAERVRAKYSPRMAAESVLRLYSS